MSIRNVQFFYLKDTQEVIMLCLLRLFLSNYLGHCLESKQELCLHCGIFIVDNNFKYSLNVLL